MSELQKELEKFTNQARFVKMIIDNKLSIARKKKPVLIAELQKLGFKAFPKVQDASKAGELERPVEEEEDDSGSDDVNLAASSYDYLLGMPLWSLTQERIEKLLRQIGDKEMEIDTLIKLSKEDLWKRDLDDFLAEWEAQLLEEKTRQKRVRGTTRRISSKLALGDSAPAVKKRKAHDDDDDFEVKPKKAATQKKAREEKQTSSIRDWLAAPPRESPPVDQVDGASTVQEVPAAKPKVAAKTKIKKPTLDSDADDSEAEVISKPPARGARAAAQKSFKYALSSDSDTDNGDDLLGDVSKMVKGIGATNGDSSNDSRALFSSSMSRPGSSAGVKPVVKPAKVPDFSPDADETDYSKLVPQQSPRRSILVTAKDIKLTDDEDEDEELPAVVAKPKPLPKSSKITKASKPAAKVASKPAAKGRAKKEASGPAKPLQLSPAAKAYAAKQAKSKKPTFDSDDDIDAMADDILDSPSSNKGTKQENSPAPARPARRAAATKKKLTYIVDDESDEGESNHDESSAMFSEDDD